MTVFWVSISERVGNDDEVYNKNVIAACDGRGTGWDSGDGKFLFGKTAIEKIDAMLKEIGCKLKEVNGAEYYYVANEGVMREDVESAILDADIDEADMEEE